MTIVEADRKVEGGLLRVACKSGEGGEDVEGGSGRVEDVGISRGE